MKLFHFIVFLLPICSCTSLSKVSQIKLIDEYYNQLNDEGLNELEKMKGKNWVKNEPIRISMRYYIDTNNQVLFYRSFTHCQFQNFNLDSFNSSFNKNKRVITLLKHLLVEKVVLKENGYSYEYIRFDIWNKKGRKIPIYKSDYEF